MFLFLQDVSWFDLKEVAALPAEINDDLEILHIDLGEISGQFITTFPAE